MHFIKIFFLLAANPTPCLISNSSENQVLMAVAVLDKLMKQRGYGLHDGKVYKKIKQSRFTFIYCSSVKTFISRALGNKDVAPYVAPRKEQVTSLLADPSCRLIKPIVIDYNLIEVLPPGTCFHIALKKFIHHESLKVSTRAFVKYTYHEDRVPYPGPFVEGIILYSFYYIYFLQKKKKRCTNDYFYKEILQLNNFLK